MNGNASGLLPLGSSDEKHFCKIDRHKDLWARVTILGRPEQAQSSQEKVA